MDQTGSFLSSKTRLGISEFKNIFYLHIFRCGVSRVKDKNHVGVTKRMVCSSISNRHPVLHYFHNFGFHSLALHQRRGYTSTKLHIEFPHHIYIICDINLTNPVFGFTALYIFWVPKGSTFCFWGLQLHLSSSRHKIITQWINKSQSLWNMLQASWETSFRFNMISWVFAEAKTGRFSIFFSTDWSISHNIWISSTGFRLIEDNDASARGPSLK